jgi:hypothetical protein
MGLARADVRPDVRVSSDVVGGLPGEALVAAAGNARLLVVGSRALGPSAPSSWGPSAATAPTTPHAPWSWPPRRTETPPNGNDTAHATARADASR